MYKLISLYTTKSRHLLFMPMEATNIFDVVDRVSSVSGDSMMRQEGVDGDAYKWLLMSSERYYCAYLRIYT